MLHNWRSGRHVSHTLYGHTDEVFCAMRRDHLLFTGSQDSTIKLWDIHTGEPQGTWTDHTSWVSCLCADRMRDNSIYSGGHDGTIRTWDLNSGKASYCLNFDAACVAHGLVEGNLGSQRFILSVQPIDDYTLLVGTMDKTIRLLDMRTGQVTAAMPGHNSYVSCLLPIDGGAEIYSGSGDSQIRHWDLRMQRCMDIRSFHTSPVTCLKRHGSELISSSEDGHIKFWRQNNVETSHEKDEIWGFDLNKRFLVNGCEYGAVEVRDVVNGRLRYQIKGHAGPVGVVLVEDDCVITASEDKLVKIWKFDHLGEEQEEGEPFHQVTPLLPPGAPDLPTQLNVPPSPPRVPFMPDNLHELADGLVQQRNVFMLQSFLTSLGFNDQCPPEGPALVEAARALADATVRQAKTLREAALKHWGPGAASGDRLPLVAHQHPDPHPQ